MNYQAELADLIAEKDFFIGVDSDGCVFDSMEIKHKECFTPAFIKHFNLQVVSKYARESWEFVNLYSKSRGCNRFHALINTLDLLRLRPEVIARGAKIIELPRLKQWVSEESKLGNPSLKALLDESADDELQAVYNWSLEVNQRVEDMVLNLPPFPVVPEILKVAGETADMMVISQTPLAALEREWSENKLKHLIRHIAGQEHGTKTEHIALAAGDKYASSANVLMIGDAPGDYQAAKENAALFFPIIPGAEDASWDKFANEAMERFFKFKFEGVYQQSLLVEFEAALPECPPWK